MLQNSRNSHSAQVNNSDGGGGVVGGDGVEFKTSQSNSFDV